MVRKPTDTMLLGNTANFVMTGRFRKYLEQYRAGEVDDRQMDAACSRIADVCKSWSVGHPFYARHGKGER